MKALLIAISAMLCLGTQAKVWRVNNIASTDPDFTAAQAAHDDANVKAGDTLYFEHSPTTYGNLILTKKLTIIGAGNFLAENPGLQYKQDAPFLNYVTANAAAAGSVFHCNMYTLTLGANANNCRVERCYIYWGAATGGLDIYSSGNVVVGNFIKGRLNLQSPGANNVIANNIVGNYLYNEVGSSATISNNIINALNANNASSLTNCVFENNIIKNTCSYTFTSCTVRNNLTANTTLPAGNGNVNGVNMANVFADAAGMADISFKLKTGSPAIGAGISGIDCGAYGGNTPFVAGMQPAIPSIYNLTVPATASGNSMNIIFSTRSNN